jgi:hypothetical protein
MMVTSHSKKNSYLAVKAGLLFVVKPFDRDIIIEALKMGFSV